jgi:hypothetical protein
VAVQRETAIRLQQELDGYFPRLDQSLILQLFARNVSGHRQTAAYADRYRGLAAVGEILKITPASVRLTELRLDLGPHRAAGERAVLKRTLVLKGIVTGDRLEIESILAGFLLKLEGSPLFEKAQVLQRSLEHMGNEPVLRFTASTGVI